MGFLNSLASSAASLSAEVTSIFRGGTVAGACGRGEKGEVAVEHGGGGGGGRLGGTAGGSAVSVRDSEESVLKSNEIS